MAYDNQARENWHRYLYLRDRGHLEYIAQAAINQGMYLGGGEQWREDVKAVLESEGRPWYEFNEVMASVNAALGHQIQNRMDVSFRPRGGDSDLFKATTLSKVCMQAMDRNNYHWLETQLYADGLIEQRGYVDMRMDFTNNVLGELVYRLLDPRDVMPDSDSKAYDPDGWSDVTVSRWLTLDEIEGLYGKDARTKADASGDEGPDWGTTDEETERNTFGTTGTVGLYDAIASGDGNLKRFRILDRQKWVMQQSKVLIWPDTGDVKALDLMSADQQATARAEGAVDGTRNVKRIKWTVTTYCETLFDQLSPYEHFTVVPYFAYFRRGKTRGMVDNAIGPQEVLNKAISQFVHIVNGTANSGWIVEENSLTNMDVNELEEVGAMTGLVLEYRKGAAAPKKIEPNQVPNGVDRLIDRATQTLKDVTVPDAMRGLQGNAVSGVAKRTDQFASQQQLAVCLDNLGYTRQMVATRSMKMLQRFYSSYRVFKITETDQRTGQPQLKTLEINKPMPDGSYWNDITAGTYDVVIDEQPMAGTFENSQYQQTLEMREKGVRIPDSTVVRYSSLADKQAIIDSMDQSDPAKEAETELVKANAMLTRSKAINLDMQTIYSSIETAGAIVMTPQVSPLSDSLLGSVGFEDKDAAPVVPSYAGQQLALPAPGNPQHPLSPQQPASASAGLMQGSQTQRAEPAIPQGA